MENKLNELLENVNLNFNIDKPIIFFDLETTGLDLSNDRIIQLSAVKILLDKQIETIELRFNPDGVKIGEGATKVHGITFDMVKDEPLFRDSAKEIFEFFNDCDIAGYNIKNFDIPLLMEEFLRSGYIYDPMKSKSRIIDVFKILSKKEPRDLSSAYKFYTGNNMDNSHDAIYDNLATLQIFNEQTSRYYDSDNALEMGDIDSKTDNDGNIMIDFSGLFLKDKNGNYFFGKGKHKDQILSLEQKDYFDWVINTSNFNNNTKYVASELLRWLEKKKK